MAIILIKIINAKNVANNVPHALILVHVRHVKVVIMLLLLKKAFVLNVQIKIANFAIMKVFATIVWMDISYQKKIVHVFHAINHVENVKIRLIIAIHVQLDTIVLVLKNATCEIKIAKQ